MSCVATMKTSKEKLSAVFQYVDGVLRHRLKREPTDEEKALAHDAIFQASIESGRNRIPFASAFERLYPKFSARHDFEIVYQSVRSERGRIEGILAERVKISISRSPRCPLPLLGLQLAVLFPSSK